MFENAVAIVRLNDVSKIDAPSVCIAESIIDPIHGLRDRIPFSLAPDKKLLASHSYVLAAEIRLSGGRPLRPGDFLTTAAFPWTVNDRGDKLIDVSEI
jgi:hypothetical protein